ncbi:MAG TPA: hypothetical protein VFZ34_27355 [Blastocatellia bacterium]|nr:hypothetical protein [Blastocatellia bacterium]
MQSLDLSIEIVSRTEAGKILCSPRRCAEITWLVSIGEPHDPFPAGYRNVQRRLRLLFADVVEEGGGPTEEHVASIIRLAETIQPVGGKVLIHCEAGISRSTAAALIMYACWLGPEREREAMDNVIQQRPYAMPNRRMVAFADKLLAREGRLVAVAAECMNFYEH